MFDPVPEQPPERAVVITGIGLVTPLGDTLQAFGSALFAGDALFSAVATRFAAPVPGACVTLDVGTGLARSEAQLADRSTRLALRAATQALHHAGWRAQDDALQRCAVFVGCGVGPTQSVDMSYAALHTGGRMAGTTLLRCLPSGAASAIAIRHGLRGPAQTYTNACASSAVAIGEAMRAIRHGYIDMALVGGTEAPFGDATVKAWEALRVLAPLGSDAGAACRPFDSSRRGMVLGEGAVFFVLEAADPARARGATLHAQIAGYGTSGDGHHWTEPSSRGQVQAMALALRDARLAPADIGCINAHGTGTPVGDAVEAASISAVFGAGAAGPLVTSTKASHGHLLGASGAIELAAAVLTLKHGLVPPTRNLLQADPGCALNLVVGNAAPLPAGSAVLSNSFAFGGSNACLVLTAA